MTQSAYEFGKQHDSCILHEREEFDRLNPGKGQTGFYAACQDGAYLIWQLRQLPENQLMPYKAQLAEIAKRATKRAGGYATDTDTYDYAYAHATDAISGYYDDSAVVYVVYAAAAATHYACLCADLANSTEAEAAAARQKERQLQADDVHELIPVWPGD